MKTQLIKCNEAGPELRPTRLKKHELGGPQVAEKTCVTFSDGSVGSRWRSRKQVVKNRHPRVTLGKCSERQQTGTLPSVSFLPDRPTGTKSSTWKSQLSSAVRGKGWLCHMSSYDIVKADRVHQKRLVPGFPTPKNDQNRLPFATRIIQRAPTKSFQGPLL